MTKVINMIVLNAGPLAPRSHATLRVYDTVPGQPPVVLVSEPSSNPGMSITNMAEKLCEEVTRHYPELSPERTVWLEHYPPQYGEPASFDRITFPNGRAHWQSVSTEEVISLLGEMPPFYK